MTIDLDELERLAAEVKRLYAFEVRCGEYEVLSSQREAEVRRLRDENASLLAAGLGQMCRLDEAYRGERRLMLRCDELTARVAQLEGALGAVGISRGLCQLCGWLDDHNPGCIVGAALAQKEA